MEYLKCYKIFIIVKIGWLNLFDKIHLKYLK